MADKLPIDYMGTREPQPEELHIGDGVYASYDGYQIWLRVDRYGVQERVALEPRTFLTLMDYARTIWTGI